MKKIFSLIILVTTVATSNAQQINDPNIEQRDLKGFHEIELRNGIELKLVQGNEEAVAISAPDQESRNKITTKVENGVLKIGYAYNPFRDKRYKKLRAYVSVKNLDRLRVAYGAVALIQGKLKTEDIKLQLEGGAVLEGDIEAAKMEIVQSSGSIITIEGESENVKIEGASGAIFKGYNFNTQLADIKTSSGSQVQITVNKELTANVSSGGMVSYMGAGVIRNINSRSGGQVSKKS